MKATRAPLFALSMLFIGLALFPLTLQAQTARGERAFERLVRQLEMTPERASALKQDVEFADDATLWEVATDLRTHLTTDEKAKLIASAGSARGPRAGRYDQSENPQRARADRRQNRRKAVQGRRMAEQGRRMAAQGRRMAETGRRMQLSGRDADLLDRIPDLTPEQTARIERIRSEARAKAQELRTTEREEVKKRAEVREQLRTQTQEAVRDVLTDEQKETLDIQRALTRSTRPRARRM